jgi:hypothetical protein
MTGSATLIGVAWAGWLFALLKRHWAIEDRRAMVERHRAEVDSLRSRIQITNGGRP